jgi:hypothetical protein
LVDNVIAVWVAFGPIDLLGRFLKLVHAVVRAIVVCVRNDVILKIGHHLVRLIEQLVVYETCEIVLFDFIGLQLPRILGLALRLIFLRKVEVLGELVGDFHLLALLLQVVLF